MIPSTAVDDRRWMVLLTVVVVSVTLRLRFVFTPVTSDEGGYLAVARAWRGGATLYQDVWVDRPQGLLILYGLIDAVGLGRPEGIRLLAIAACIVAASACASIAARLAGPRAGFLAALLVAVLTSVPQYEGFIANAELLSCAVGSAALAVALRAVWNRDVPDHRTLVVAGLLGGVALSVKQSAFDALAAAVVAVALMASPRVWSRRDRLVAPLALAAGAAVPLAAMAVHGLVTGWDRWWYAVAGYRSSQRSALRQANWDRLAYTWDIVAPVLGPVAVVIAVGTIVMSVSSTRRRHLPTAVLLAVWFVAALAAFALGGQFHRHYWMILVFPVATIAAVVVDRAGSPFRRGALLAAVLVGPLVAFAQAATIDRDDVGVELNGDGRLLHDEAIGAWFSAHSSPGDQLLPLCASAGFFGNVDADPAYPYLWLDGMIGAAGAPELLVATLEGADAPRFVAEYQRPSRCDPTGDLSRVVRERYRPVANVDGVRILESVG